MPYSFKRKPIEINDEGEREKKGQIDEVGSRPRGATRGLLPTHPRMFEEVGGHDDAGHVVLPDHSPEVSDCP